MSALCPLGFSDYLYFLVFCPRPRPDRTLFTSLLGPNSLPTFRRRPSFFTFHFLTRQRCNFAMYKSSLFSRSLFLLACARAPTPYSFFPAPISQLFPFWPACELPLLKGCCFPPPQSFSFTPSAPTPFFFIACFSLFVFPPLPPKSLPQFDIFLLPQNG